MGLLKQAKKSRMVDITLDKGKKTSQIKEKIISEISESQKEKAKTESKEKKGFFGMFKKKEKKIELPDVPEPPKLLKVEKLKLEEKIPEPIKEIKEEKKIPGLAEPKKEKKSFFGMFEKKEKIKMPEVSESPKPLEVEKPKLEEKIPEPEKKIPELAEPKKEKKGFFGMFKKKEKKPISVPGLEELPDLDIPEPPSLEEIPGPPTPKEPEPVEKKISKPVIEEFKPVPEEIIAPKPKEPEVKAFIPEPSEPTKPIEEHPETVKLKEEHEKLQREVGHKRDELKRIEHDLEIKRKMTSESEKKLDEKEKIVQQKIKEMTKIKDTIEAHKKDISGRTQKMEKTRIMLEKQHGAAEELEKRKKELDERERKVKENEENLLREQKELEEGEFKEYMSEILKELTPGEKARGKREAEPEVADYIRRHVEKGISPEKIEDALLRAGWTQEEIDSGFEQTHHLPIHHETHEMHGDVARLESMITNVKHAIMAKNIPEAQNTLADTKEFFDSIEMDPHKKELLKFELQELKTEIDLTLLR